MSDRTYSTERVNFAGMPGTVEVTRTPAVTVELAWRALIDPAEVTQWFGQLSGPLEPETHVRLDFGDGDFFDLEVIAVEAPKRLEYHWRFLGIGPVNKIRWVLEADKNRTKVTVYDHDPGRSSTDITMLIEGWRDFTRRLVDYLETGASTRYDWRRDFDGSVELYASLEDASENLFAPQGQPQWLPLTGDRLVPGACLRVDDGGRPARLTISSVDWHGPRRIDFVLEHPAWSRPTNVRLQMLPRSEHSLLVVSHTGWGTIHPSDSEQQRQRKRCSKLWIKALQRAQEIMI